MRKIITGNSIFPEMYLRYSMQKNVLRPNKCGNTLYSDSLLEIMMPTLKHILKFLSPEIKKSSINQTCLTTGPLPAQYLVTSDRANTP